MSESLELTAYQAAREAFGSYAGMDAPNLPELPMQRLQVALCRWQNREFGTQDSYRFLLGFIEEVGEMKECFDQLFLVATKMAKVQLKHEQGIRGYDDAMKYRSEMADGIADAQVYLTQLCTNIRCDNHTLMQHTAERVMKRTWRTNKVTGGE